MGGYHDDADFDELELSAYQRLYLNGGPFPTAEGQVAIVAGTGVGGGTVVNWTNCLRTHDWVRAEWAREHGLDGSRPSRASTRTSTRSGSGSRSTTTAPTCTARTSACRRPARSSATTSARSPATPTPRPTTPETAAYMGFGDQSGSKQSTAKTYLVDAQAATARDPRRLPASQRILVEDGRAAGVEARLDRSRCRRRRTAARRDHGVDRVGRRSSSSPAARSSRRRCCCARGSAARPSATTCACTRRPPSPRFYDEPPELDVGPAAGGALARVRRPRRRPRLPDRVGAGDDRPLRRRRAVALGRRPQAPDARVGPRLAADQPGPRARPRPGRDRRRRQRR